MEDGRTVAPSAALAIPRSLFATLILAMLGPSLTLVTLSPSLPLVAAYFGGGQAGERIAQGAQGLTFLGAALGGLIAGVLLQLHDLRTMLCLGAALYAGAGLLAILSWGAAPLLCACFVVGVMAAVLSSGLAMATGAVLQGEPRSRMLGYQAGLSDGSGIIIGALGGFVAQAVNWRAPFAIYIAFGALTFLLAFISRPQAPQRAKGTKSGGLLQTLRLAWSTYLCAILFAVPLGSLQIQLPFRLAAYGITSAGERGLIQTLSICAAACTSVNFGLLRKHLGERRMLLLAGAAGFLSQAGYALWHGGFWLALFPAIGSGIGIGIGIPMLFVFALRRVPSILHAHAVGALNTAIFMGTAMSGALLTPIGAIAGQSMIYWVCAGLVAATTVGVGLGVKGDEGKG